MQRKPQHHSDTADFDAAEFFRSLTEKNRLARSHGFVCRTVSDLEGFGEALETRQSQTPLVCVSDTSAGRIDLDNTPRTRRLKTVFLFMPHPVTGNWESHRQQRFAVMRELFRQFMSVLIREQTRLHLEGIYIDRSVAFEEIDRYFFSGGACAYFQIAVDKFTDLQLREEEWEGDPTPPRHARLESVMPRPSTAQ